MTMDSVETKQSEIINERIKFGHRGKYQSIEEATLQQTLTVTPHAIQRYRERTGLKQSEEKVRKKIFKIILEGCEVKLKPEYRIIALINHRFENARYFTNSNGMIVVVENNVVKTIHKGTANRWEQI